MRQPGAKDRVVERHVEELRRGVDLVELPEGLVEVPWKQPPPIDLRVIVQPVVVKEAVPVVQQLRPSGVVYEVVHIHDRAVRIQRVTILGVDSFRGLEQLVDLFDELIFLCVRFEDRYNLAVTAVLRLE
jgi:hypothetical protein